MTNKNYLLKYAIEYLSKYSSSKKNLERILRSKINRLTYNNIERKQLYEKIMDVINTLEMNKLLSDRDYANDKIFTLSSRGKSKNFIIQYLISKGINKITINNQIEELEKSNPEWEEKSAIFYAKKKKLINSNENYKKKLAKMARAGFSYEISKKIIN